MTKDQLNMRRAVAGDMPTLYLFGYDEWGEGRSETEHIAGCHASTKYLKGTWYLLEKEDEPVAVLICYRGAFNLPDGSSASVRWRRNHRSAAGVMLRA